MTNFYKDSNTKPFAIAITVLFILLIGFVVWFICMGKPADADPAAHDYYALATTVCAIDRDADVVVCEDYNGNVWEFYGAEDWEVGDNANLLMDTMGTTTIYDDAIAGATYGGWVLNK